ncbi:putative FAD binding protein [Lasiosphaeria hispida]|uniref:FAD binding protein n=1 Tax=Lasiosphaeria hispida TaxID=260671 RepID=A0AAJ0H4T7_9PEZI|nr:putative FAD binding protein [Lasiosphaeria hispida]
MSSKNAPRTLVILGAGVGGVPLAHHVLRFTAPKVPNLRVILVSPNTHFYWNLASPRAILSEEFSDKLFLPLAPAFAQYGDKFELVHGVATSLDPDRNAVVVSLTDGGTREIAYNAVVVATGSSDAQGLPWKGLGSTAATQQALQDLRRQIDGARTIVVAGAGATGVEIAGELAVFSAAGAKDVVLVIPDALPLAPPAKPGVRDAVRAELEKRKVRIVPNTRVTAATATTTPAGSTTTLELTTKSGAMQTLVADVYLPAFGVRPNTAFAPARLLAASGQFKQTHRLRAEGYENVFIIGDAGDLEETRALYTDNQMNYVARALLALLTGGTDEAAKYKPGTAYMLGLSIGKDAGAGQAMGFKIPGWVVWYIKSRTLGTSYTADIVAGQRSMVGKMKA